MDTPAPSRRQVQTVIRSIQTLLAVPDDVRAELHETVDRLKTWTAGDGDTEPAPETEEAKSDKSSKSKGLFGSKT